MTTLFSYVVEHDEGFAPNPFGGFCTLAKCKYRKGNRRNIVELAQIGDWVAGTGGQNLKKSAGNGKLIYAMRVDEKLSWAAYYADLRFQGRIDNTLDGSDRTDRFVLISRHFFYFGRNAVDIALIPTEHLEGAFEKKGVGYQYKNFSEEFVTDFAQWFEANYPVGVHGIPCGQRRVFSAEIKLY